MDHRNLPPQAEQPIEKTAKLDVPLESPAIQRLIDEVRAEPCDVPRSYNRTYNRHNR
jgi:hypothetical protein